MRLRGDRNQCPSCGKCFNSTYAFDRHRTGDWGARRCLNTDEMLAAGMTLPADGFWRSASRAPGWKRHREAA